MPSRSILRVAVLAWLAGSLLLACRSSGTGAGAGGERSSELYHRPISTRSAAAQRLFDQGLLLCYGFNHDEAIRAFQRAAELDPTCSMAQWGIAWAAGPNINNAAMDAERSRIAHAAATRAFELSEGESGIERELILALAARYAQPEPEDRRALDEAFAGAMREVAERHPRDADVATICAEALMDLRPWALWTKDGEPAPETAEITELLARALEIDSLHPGALHYTIHAWEASPTPERALCAAELLRGRVPGAGHLAHMPSHIDVRVGQWEEAVLANQRAVAADLAYVERVGRGGFYELYRAHNYHMLVFAAMFDGQSRVALAAARELLREIPEELVAEMPIAVDAFLAVPYHALVRFGRWEEILREDEPDPNVPATYAFWHYARGIALSALDRIDEAEAERQAFELACEAVPARGSFSLNASRDVLDVARAMLEGELEYRRGNLERAFELLRTAVARDDGLNYDEPWGWMMPARHSLGALLVEQGRFAEAEQVYRADLARNPRNGWSLHGLAECLERLGRPEEAREARTDFERAWARADVELVGSCFCRTGA